jgi:hypothetical protein
MNAKNRYFYSISNSRNSKKPHQSFNFHPTLCVAPQHEASAAALLFEKCPLF